MTSLAQRPPPPDAPPPPQPPHLTLTPPPPAPTTTDAPPRPAARGGDGPSDHPAPARLFGLGPLLAPPLLSRALVRVRAKSAVS